MTTLAEKIVLLTGASRGIGVFIALALVRENATIIGVSRSPEELDQVSTQVKSLGGKWIGLPFDISQIKKLPFLVQQIEQVVGSVDILINNAGIELYRAFQDYSTADIQLVLSTNLLAAMELSRLILPTFLRQGSGHIVNIASLAAKKGLPYNSIYSASKAGLLMWSDSLRQELVGTGVEISIICPGYVSQQGMFVDSGVPAPRLSGISAPVNVANAVVRAIKHNQAEIMVNQDLLTECLTRFLFVIGQFFPKFVDVVYRYIGVVDLNKTRVKNQKKSRLVRVYGFNFSDKQ